MAGERTLAGVPGQPPPPAPRPSAGSADRDLERWTGDVVLSDGGTVHVRAVRPDDAPLVAAFHARQSPESIYYRYFTARPTLTDRELEHLTVVDHRDRVAFVALLGDDLVGIARYDRFPGRNEAEVAFFVDDAHQRRGIGVLLLEYLAAAGREQGFERFTAQVLPSNRRMLSVFQAAGFETSSRFDEGVVEIILDLEPTDEARERMAARARRSEVASVSRLLAPTSVAVVGAGRRPGTFGHELVEQIRAHGYRGPLFAVNPHAAEVGEVGEVAGVAAHASVLDVPDQIGLAIVAVPAPEVLEVVQQCARRQVQSLVVVSAGFADAGAEGARAEAELVRLARRHGMRLLGPHSLGVVNTDPAVALHAVPTPAGPEPGPVAFLTQSGTLGVAVLDRLAEEGLGLSSFVSLGNKADVSANDLLRWWEQDERTEVVLVYLESLGNPRTFSRVARRLSRTKPVVALRASAADGEAEALAATTLDQAGVIAVDRIGSVLDVARLLVGSPRPPGRRVRVITSSGTPAALAADACVGEGLDLAGPPTRLTHRAGPDDYRHAVASALAEPDVDAVLVVLAPPALGGDHRPGRPLPALGDLAEAAGKPVLLTRLGGPAASAPGGPERSGPAGEAPEGAAAAGAAVGVPTYAEPADAARALAAVVRYQEFLERDPGRRLAVADVDLEAAADVVAQVLGREPDGGLVGPDRTQRLLAAFGIAPASRRLAFSADDAVEAAERLGFPVALKATGLARLRQSEAGGVALDLQDAAAVRAAHQRMTDRLGAAMRPAVVQRMLPAGVDVAVRLHQDPTGGSVVACGLGGAARGAAPEPRRALPVTDVDAARLVAASAVGPLLADLDPTGRATANLENLVLRLALLGEACPEAAEVVLNPVIVSPEQAGVADATVEVAPYGPAPGPEVRRLDPTT